MVSDRLRPAMELLDAEELARLSERARLDAHTGVKGFDATQGQSAADRDALLERQHALFCRGLVGLRFAASAYALRRDAAGLTPIVWGSWTLAAERFDMRRDAADMMADAVASAGPRLLAVPGLAERLARSPWARVRLALARTLPPSEEPLLIALAADHDRGVRAAAAERLGLSDEWGGAFPISPEGHPREVLEAARRVLDTEPHRVLDDPARAVSALEPLSDALALACWERLLSAELGIPAAWSPWIARMLARPGGGAALARVAALADARGRLSLRGERWLAGALELDEATRGRATQELLASMPTLETRGGARASSARQDLAEIVLLLTPAEGDARALLEAVLGAPIEQADDAPGRLDSASMSLSKLLARWPLEPPVRAAMIEARRRGKPGAWARVGSEVWKQLGPDPVLRERALADLDSEDARVRREAIASVLGEHRDPDGGDALARELYLREPALRDAVLSAAPALIPDARHDLERGALDLAASIHVMIYTPPPEQTDAMWAAVRALRDAALAAGGDERERALHHVHTLARGGAEWDPSDLAFVRVVAELALSSPDESWRLFALIPTLESVDGSESDALLAQIDASAPGHVMRSVPSAG